MRYNIKTMQNLNMNAFETDVYVRVNTTVRTL